MNRRFLACAIAGAVLALTPLVRPGTLLGQTSGRLATTPEALVAFPLFYNAKQIVIRTTTTETPRVVRLANTAKPVYVFWKDRPSRSEGEIRGEFWDLGRMPEGGDSRFSTIDFKPVLEEASNGQWPGRDQVFAILGATLADVPPPPAPSVRAIAMVPARFDGQRVTVTGRFHGRNLLGALPQGLGKSKWDFVLQSADAAVWISGLRPRGNNFELDAGARVDTGRWLEVVGTVHVDGPVVWLAGESLKQATAPTEPVETPAPAEPPPVPRVIFSAPIADETDVAPTVVVRVQFSWDMVAKSFHDHIRIRYTGKTSPSVPPPPFTVTYQDATRGLEIRFKQPLEPQQRVTIDLMEGILAAGGGALVPWTLSFTTGG